MNHKPSISLIAAMFLDILLIGSVVVGAPLICHYLLTNQLPQWTDPTQVVMPHL